MSQRRTSGLIAYLRQGQETGREWFERITHTATGAQSLRAFCEMDDVGLTRDVTYFLGRDGRPVDAFCRVTLDGDVKGTALFLQEDGAFECEARTVDLGRVSQRLPTPEGGRYLGLHPLVGDALAAVARGTSSPGEFLPVQGVTNSISPNGDQGLVAVPVTIDVAYQGEEEVTVRAGTFATRRYALRWSPEWPAPDLWVTEAEALFVKLCWEMVDAAYELVELRRDA
ncbi:hypothetical protein SAMN06296065_1213 [Novosphingobium panipatense]|uniref:Uncharacterized protein n=1 Tax=Novosphingobium panipatense TaxID=428991 RepID=A0ABY1QVH7_9SPHN|nr:hypothetical protein SAMN06296065_1213 [Novosphingobium panipatense]